MSNNKKLIIPIFFLIFISTFIYAWGPGGLYSAGIPLVLSPGDSKEVVIELQNLVGGGDLKIQATLLKGLEITSLDNSIIYDVPFGRNDIPVKLQINIPKDAKIGTDYTVTILFSPVSSGSDGGFIPMSGAIEKTFPVQVREKAVPLVVSPPAPVVVAEKTNTNSNATFYLVFGLIILIIAIILYYLFKGKNMDQTVQTTQNLEQAPFAQVTPNQTQATVQTAQPASPLEQNIQNNIKTVEIKLDDKPIVSSKKVKSKTKAKKQKKK